MLEIFRRTFSNDKAEEVKLTKKDDDKHVSKRRFFRNPFSQSSSKKKSSLKVFHKGMKNSRYPKKSPRHSEDVHRAEEEINKKSNEREAVRRKLCRSVETKDYGAMRKAVREAHAIGVERIEEAYEKAIESLARHDHLHTMQEISIRSLVHAIREADRNLLKSAITQAKDTKLRSESCKQLKDAQTLLDTIELGSSLFRLHKEQSFADKDLIIGIKNKMRDALKFSPSDHNQLTTFGSLLQEARDLGLNENDET